MKYTITVLPQGIRLEVSEGTNLLDALRAGKLSPEAPCGGNGSCGKCRVLVDGQEVLACQTSVMRDMTVELPEMADTHILHDGITASTEISPVREGYLLAFDIGTTTVVGYLLDGKSGKELAHGSMLNPQAPFGADVISRIQYALNGNMDELNAAIQNAVESIIEDLCQKAGISPGEVGVVSIVGNPAMQQLFLGIPPVNLAAVPFDPVLTEAKVVTAKQYIPCCNNAALLIVPDISGYVGADTVACVLSTGMDKEKDITLLVDIGTNGEMVLCSKNRITACSTAAGPALEGAKIQFGMRGAPGAIDHVWLEHGEIKCSVIGGGEAIGICGSGLIDAVAVALEAGLINRRGRIQSREEINGQRIIRLTDRIYLTQDDIREVQMAKGAIAAGIELMAAHLDLAVQDITKVYLAGAFGSFMNSESACRIGLLPEVLRGRITAVGNAAGSGAKKLACSMAALDHTRMLVARTEFIELASIPGFQRCFAKNMGF